MNAAAAIPRAPTIAMNHVKEVRREQEAQQEEEHSRKYSANLFEDPMMKKARKTSYDFKREMERVMLSQIAQRNSENLPGDHDTRTGDHEQDREREAEKVEAQERPVQEGCRMSTIQVGRLNNSSTQASQNVNQIQTQPSTCVLGINNSKYQSEPNLEQMPQDDDSTIQKTFDKLMETESLEKQAKGHNSIAPLHQPLQEEEDIKTKTVDMSNHKEKYAHLLQQYEPSFKRSYSAN